MSKKDKSIDLSKLKITSGLSLIGILIGFGVSIGVNVNSFNNMKEQLSGLSETMDDLESKLYDKFEKQTATFNTEIKEVRDSNSRMEGKMDAYLQNLK
ncbi:MAG: hypothetical protein K0U54_05635 [Bacteroidetes bacterium]|nr:hypothetical protein [Bacteroidota bacterium]